MEIQQIKYFIEAAKFENFSKAAEQLCISPQSVAKQIALLERELGMSLFDRVGRKVILNSSGKYVFMKLSRVDEELETAISDIRRFVADNGKKVRISIFSALPKKSVVTPLLSGILTRFPELQIEIRMLSIEEAIGQVMSGEADIVLTNIEESDDEEGLERIVFLKRNAQIVVASGHPWWNKNTVTIEDMEKMDVVKIGINVRISNSKGKIGLYDSIPCRKEIFVPNFDTMYTILQQGKVFGVFPDVFANVDNMEFHFFDLPIEAPRFDTAAIYKRNNENPAVKQVVRYLKNELEL